MLSQRQVSNKVRMRSQLFVCKVQFYSQNVKKILWLVKKDPFLWLTTGEKSMLTFVVRVNRPAAGLLKKLDSVETHMTQICASSCLTVSA